MPIVTLPIKIQLTGAGLGPTCFIGSEQNPIVLHPANTSLAGVSASWPPSTRTARPTRTARSRRSS